MSYLLLLIFCFIITLPIVYAKKDKEFKSYSVQTHGQYLIKTILYLSPFFIYTAFRDVSVGKDTIQYYYEYISTVNGGIFRKAEPLFSYIQIFFSKLNINFQGFVFFQSYIYYIAFLFPVLLVPRLSPFVYTLIIMCMFLFTFGASGMRQSFAMSLFLFSIPLLLRNKLILYFILSVIAYNLHNSSVLVFSMAFLLYKFKISEKFFLLLLLLSPVASIINPSLLNNLKFFNIKQISMFNDESDLLLHIKVPLSIWLLTLIVTLVMIYGKPLRLVSSWSEKERNFPYKSFVLIMTLCMCYLLWMATSVRLVDRLGFYLIPFFAVFSSWVLGSKQKKISEWILYIYICMLLIIMFFYTQKVF